MIRSYSLHTSAADVVADALADITRQLSQITLCTHSVGIIVCHYDFLHSGVVPVLAKRLPFPLIGCTSFYQATPSARGLFELTITLLTSDDVQFSVGSSDDAERDLPPLEQQMRVYERALQLHMKPPKLLLSFLSMNRPVTGDEFLRGWDHCSGGVPVFGGITTGDDDSGKNMYVISSNGVSNAGFVLLLISGDVTPSFFCGHFKAENLMMMTATVTAAEGNTVQTLNDRPATHFLERSGVTLSDEMRSSLLTIPFLVTLPQNGARIARTLMNYDETGAALFLGEIPQGASLQVGTANSDDLQEVTRQLMTQAVQTVPDAAVWLLFSCVGRYVTLGLAPTLELDCLPQLIPADASYLASYVGGEFCPLSTEFGISNHFHNSSFIACALI